MEISRPHSAFSLLEVVVAIAIFGASVSVLLGWLPGLARQAERGIDRATAQRLADGIKVELDRLGAERLDGLAARLPVLTQVAAGGLVFAAPRSGNPVSCVDASEPARVSNGDDVFFQLECWRFGNEGLRYASEKRFLAVAVRARWPAHAVAASPAGRFEESWFVVALNR